MPGEQKIFYNKDYFKQRIGIFDKNRKIVEKKRLNALKQYILPKKLIKILDIGCGTGYFLALCDKENWQTFGVDISNYALVEASFYTKAELHQVDLNSEQLPFENNFFDAILAMDVIEHLENDESFLQEIKRTLKRGGFFLLLTPDGHSLYDNDSTHINIYKKKDLINKLKTFGFKILDVKEDRGYTRRVIPLRRYPFINKINQRLCDLFGRYVKEVVITAKK